MTLRSTHGQKAPRRLTKLSNHMETSKTTYSASLALEISAIEIELKPLLNRMADLRRKKRDALSREFIAANRITREDVEMSNGDGKEWFGTAYEFGKWIAANSKKVWAEWNGRIYHAADLINGRMPDMPGETDHLPTADVMASTPEKTL